MKKYISQVATAMRQVFSTWQYWLVSICVAAAIVLITILLSQYQFITSVLSSELFDSIVKFKVIFSSLGVFQTNLTTENQIFAIAIALLSGITIAMVVYYFKHRFSVQMAAGTSFLGVLVGLLGVGCSACGSVVVSTIFGIGAASAFLGALPFKGTEINILSMLILLGSIYMIAKKIVSPDVCEIIPSSSS